MGRFVLKVRYLVFLSTTHSEKACRLDTDVDILSWRATHFKLHGTRAGPGFQAKFVRDLSNSIIWDQIYPFLQGIFGGRMDHPPIEMESITDIVQAAFNWNRSIKCLVPPIDLRTFVVPNDAPFDAETMEYYEKPLGSFGTKIIICAGSCGLKLYEREDSGEEEKVEVLKKIEVLVLTKICCIMCEFPFFSSPMVYMCP